MRKIKFSKWSMLTLVAVGIVTCSLLYYSVVFIKDRQLEFISTDGFKLLGMIFLIFWILLFCTILVFKNYELLTRVFVLTEKNNELIQENNNLLKQVIAHNNNHVQQCEYQYDNIVRSNMEVKEMIVDSSIDYRRTNDVVEK